MARDEDDPFGAPKPVSSGHVLGQSLDRLSIDEIDERIGLLRVEIERLETARLAKMASQAAAANFFKT